MRLFLLAGLVAALFPLATAHSDEDFHLEGVALCLDPSSVQVVVEAADEARAEAAAATIYEELIAPLGTILTALEVDAEVRPSCREDAGFTLVYAYVSYLDPNTYIGFGEAPYSYTVSVQVGAYADGDYLSENEVLPDLQYATSMSDIYSEEAGAPPFESHIVASGKEQVRQLAMFWWEDNAERLQGWTRYRPQLLGAALAVIMAGVVLGVSRSKRRR